MLEVFVIVRKAVMIVLVKEDNNGRALKNIMYWNLKNRFASIYSKDLDFEHLNDEWLHLPSRSKFNYPFLFLHQGMGLNCWTDLILLLTKQGFGALIAQTNYKETPILLLFITPNSGGIEFHSSSCVISRDYKRKILRSSYYSSYSYKDMRNYFYSFNKTV